MANSKKRYLKRKPKPGITLQQAWDRICTELDKYDHGIWFVDKHYSRPTDATWGCWSLNRGHEDFHLVSQSSKEDK